MLKASALYIVVIVSLLIAMISASLLTIAFYYRMEAQKKIRLDRLRFNIASGTALLLYQGFNSQDNEQLLDLYGHETDSLVLLKQQWGVFDVNTVLAFAQRDTLKRAFLSGCTYDDPNAIYLADEDRPLSVSGSTQIVGDGQLPKSGLKQAYVDGKPYAGGKELIKGAIKDSGRDLPSLDPEMIKNIIDRFKSPDGLNFEVQDSLHQSFFDKAIVFKLNNNQLSLSGKKLQGKIILVSDTTIQLDASTILQDVQIYAPAIMVADGFTGSCQLFARDSIVIGKHCTFNYPSFVGVFKAEEAKIQSKISLAEGVKFSGMLFSYEQKRSPLQTIISIGKSCLIKGEVYACGFLKMEKGLEIQGKMLAKRFIMQTPATLYENYLIDIHINRNLLSKYYLSSAVFTRPGTNQQILQWLN